MQRFIASVLLGGAVCVAAPLHAQSLKDRLQQGVSKAGDAVDVVGQGIGKAADSVEGTIDSTVDLITNEATPEETRAELDQMAADTLDRLFQEQPNVQSFLDLSAGYAVFDTRKVTVLGLSGGGGRGVAVSKDGDRTYMNMGTAGVGLAFGIGGFESQFVVFFETEFGFENFVHNGYDASAQAAGVAGNDGDTMDASFVDGRAIFVLTNWGWRVAATAAGTKYWPDKSLN